MHNVQDVMSVSHTIIQNPMQCPYHIHHHVQLDQILWSPASLSRIQNPTSSPESRTVPRAQHFTGPPRKDLPVPRIQYKAPDAPAGHIRCDHARKP